MPQLLEACHSIKAVRWNFLAVLAHKRVSCTYGMQWIQPYHLDCIHTQPVSPSTLITCVCDGSLVEGSTAQTCDTCFVCCTTCYMSRAARTDLPPNNNQLCTTNPRVTKAPHLVQKLRGNSAIPPIACKIPLASPGTE